MNKKSKTHTKSAIRIIEETVHILRSAPGVLLSVYYLGSVPFILGLLYFWADMSRSADAYRYSAMAAAGLSFLFVWMKSWQSVFMYQVKAQIIDDNPPPWSVSKIGSLVATQSLIQSTRIFIMPIASLMVIPFGVCYAFYQNTSVYDDEQGQTVTSACRWAWQQAKLWPQQNHLIIGIYWLFGFIILVNVAVTLIFIPQMLKTLFGIDSAFTISGVYMVLNTTFWIVVFSITYLLLDPFIKTTYVLRCFYGAARQSGKDLKAELNQIRTAKKKQVAGLLMVSLCFVPWAVMAERTETVSPADLDRSIEETMSRREFAWRMPRETHQPDRSKDEGPIEAAVSRLIEMLGKAVKKIGNWIQKIIEWLENLLPKPDRNATNSHRNWLTPVRVVLIILMILLVALVGYILVRIWQWRRPGPVEIVSATAVSTPDLTDESLKADELSTHRWLSLAGDLAEKGELRLAMRALYLATLAHLSEHEMITIEDYKSNREYERELKRRAHDNHELVADFSSSLNLFERVWYGMHRIVRVDFDTFAANHRRIMAFADK